MKRDQFGVATDALYGGHEKIDADVNVGEFFYREASPDFHVPPHRHDVYQWYICIHGGLRLWLDGLEMKVGPEQSVLVAPGTQRELRMNWCSPGYLVIFFKASDLDFSQITNKVIGFSNKQRGDVLGLVEEVGRPQLYSGAIVGCLVKKLLLELIRTHKSENSLKSESSVSLLNDNSQKEIVAMVEEYLLENSGQRIYRRELSGILHVSSSHLARVFKATTGVSIHQRLTKIRIEKAKKLLLETTLSISQVSSEVGMVSFSQFSRTFKQHVGLAPGGYRRSKGIKIE